MEEISIFYGFAGLAIISALCVVLARNAVHAVLFLILAFVATSGLWLMIEAEFLAITLVLVYVGAVMVLFLFVVMMLDIELSREKQKLVRYFPLAIMVAGILLAVLMMGYWKFGAHLSQANPLIRQAADYSNVQVLGELLYTRYLLPFEIAGLILLVSIIAAIALTFRGRRASIAPNPSEQVKVQKHDRLKIISMKSEQGEPGC